MKRVRRKKESMMKAVTSKREKALLILNLYVKLSKLNHKIRKEQNIFKKIHFQTRRQAILGEIREYKTYT